MSRNEKTPFGQVSSHNSGASLFVRVNSLYRLTEVLAILFPLTKKNAPASLNSKPA